MSKLAIGRRKATPDDLSFLVALRQETMNPHLGASGTAQSEDEHTQRVLAHFQWADVLTQDKVPVGLLKVVRQGSDWELLQVQLLPCLQGRGAGTELLEQLLCEADAAKASLRLSVLSANPARRLYERLGFVVVSKKAHSFAMQRAPNRVGNGF